MTSTSLSPAASGGFRYAVQDATTLAGRNLRHTTRQPELLVFSTVQPVLFVLLFRYVFGGSINTAATGVNYVNYLMAGIFVQTTAFASTSTGVGLAGRTLGDLVRMVGIVLIMAVVGIAVGLRPHSLEGFVGAVALTALFGFSFSWISALDRPVRQGRRDRQRRRVRVAVPADLRLVGLRPPR